MNVSANKMRRIAKDAFTNNVNDFITVLVSQQMITD
jgi:hypothetical protein